MCSAIAVRMQTRSVLFGLVLITGATIAARAQTAQTRIEQARQFNAPPTATDSRTREVVSDFPASETIVQADDAFGAQRILKEQERPRFFNAFAEVSAFFTNNVALTDRAREQDAFLVANFGMSYRRPLANNLQFEAVARGALFRYDEFDALDFNSFDAGAGLTWTPPQLKGVALFVRYNFTDLFSDSTGDKFFENHAVAIGAQKVWALSRTHAVFAGASAQFGFADPAEAQRDEYGGYAGYHWQATPALSADLFYRYGYFVYREEGQRRDHNQAFSFGLRYDVTRWMTVSGSSFVGVNRSNVGVFDYEVLNAGGGLGLSLRF